MANATAEKESSKFDHLEAACLLFPKRSVAHPFNATFLNDRILVRLGNKYDLKHFITLYQEAYFREKIGDAKWLESATPAIAGMCTNGSSPFVDFQNQGEWTPPEHDMEIPLDWLSQEIVLKYCGRTGENYYYGAGILTKDCPSGRAEGHVLGSKVLLGLVFGDSDFAYYLLRHMFEKLSYETRISIKTKDNIACLQRLKEKVQLLASEIFTIFGETVIPELLPYKNEGKKGLVARIDQIGNRTGSIATIVYLNSFTSGVGEHRSLEADVGFEVEHNMFARENVALSQLRGVEAMNLFLVRCKQLRREEESQ